MKLIFTYELSDNKRSAEFNGYVTHGYPWAHVRISFPWEFLTYEPVVWFNAEHEYLVPSYNCNKHIFATIWHYWFDKFPLRLLSSDLNLTQFDIA